MAERPIGMGASSPTLRIDKYLWFTRLANSRTNAQKLAEAGHIRINGRRVERSHAAVRAGDLITFPFGQQVRVVRVSSLPQRRGNAPEAQTCYEEIVVGS